MGKHVGLLIVMFVLSWIADYIGDEIVFVFKWVKIGMHEYCSLVGYSLLLFMYLEIYQIKITLEIRQNFRFFSLTLLLL